MLLAAGLSISPLFVASLLAYLLFSISAIIAFEIRRTARTVIAKSPVEEEKPQERSLKLLEKAPLPRLPFVAAGLLFLITLLAVPLFFMLPRVGGAGLGSNPAGTSSVTGFSDTVKLGEIGRLKQSDETVMRVRLEGDGLIDLGTIYWRGISLDRFDNKSWSKSGSNQIEKFIRGTNGYFPLNVTKADTGQRASDLLYGANRVAGAFFAFEAVIGPRQFQYCQEKPGRYY